MDSRGGYSVLTWSVKLWRGWLRGAFIGALFLGSSGDDALGQEKTRWQIGVNVDAGVPQGAFRDRIQSTRWGGAGYFTRRFRDTPFRFGVELGLFSNGNVDVVLSGIGDHGRETEDGLLTNVIYFGRFLARVQPVYGRWSPYVEGAVGAQGFETSIVVTDCVGQCTISTPSTNTTASVGGGGGLSLRLTKDEERESGFSLEVGARYLFGGTVDYFLPSDLPDLADDLVVAPQRSRTSMITISVGIVFDF